jgi:rfaE bifunctional protein nucleotidyltransferase chain/domain
MNISLTNIRQKIFDRPALIQQVKAWKKEGLTIAFTNGCFDILHPGHVDYLVKAASLADKLVIALNNDASVQKLKGPSRPIQNQEARAFIISSLAVTDAVCFFEEDTPFELISSLLPNFLIKGADYKIDEVVGADVVIRNSGSVVLLPYLEGHSTTSIEKKIRG